MCGIIHIKRFDRLGANGLVKVKFEAQKSRGTEGVGFVSFENGKFNNFQKAEEGEIIFSELDKDFSDEVLFHHRRPSSCLNVWEAAHPFFVHHPSWNHAYLIVHNGTITKKHELFEAHTKEGFEYSSLLREVIETKDGGRTIAQDFNDSESLAIEIAKDLEGEQRGLKHIDGSISFVAIQMDGQKNATKLFYGRNKGSPLQYANKDTYFIISSEGEGFDIKEDELFEYDYLKREVSSKEYKVGNFVIPVYKAPVTRYYGNNRDAHWSSDEDDDYSTLYGLGKNGIVGKNLSQHSFSEEVTETDKDYGIDQGDPIELIGDTLEEIQHQMIDVMSEMDELEEELKGEISLEKRGMIKGQIEMNKFLLEELEERETRFIIEEYETAHDPTNPTT